MNGDKGAVIVDGIALTGFKDRQAAAEAIAVDPELKRKGAVATDLGGEKPKSTFRDDFPHFFVRMR